MSIRVAVATRPGAPEVLEIQERPMPVPSEGWVRVKIHAFGLNRAEIFTRQGHSPGVLFPRVLGIECVGVVDDDPAGHFQKGQQVAAIMGEMGRHFDGGYAEYAVLPARVLIPFQSDLDWAILGAIPEMFQTTWGSLYRGLSIQAGQSLLIRGGSSSIGLLAASLAKAEGLTVLSTTRKPHKAERLREQGVDHVILDDGSSLVPKIKELFPAGVDVVLELVGTQTLKDSLRCARDQGIVCMTGVLGGEWVWPVFEPFLDIPSTVRLTAYSGDTKDLSTEALQAFLGRIERGEVQLPLDRLFRLDEIVAAHEYMEANKASGKIVVCNAH